MHSRPGVPVPMIQEQVGHQRGYPISEIYGIDPLVPDMPSSKARSTQDFLIFPDYLVADLAFSFLISSSNW